MLYAQSSLLYAGVQTKLNYQGKLKENGVAVTAVKKMEFNIYDSKTAGYCKWPSGEQNVSVKDGLFNYPLGGDESFSNIAWGNGPYFLEVVIEGVILTPREEIMGVAYSLWSGNGVPPGAIMMWPTEVVPEGWLECDGQPLDKIDYIELFAAIEYSYGGAGGSFNLPDFRGYFVRGWDNGRGVDTNRVLGSLQDQATKLPSNPFRTNTAGAHTHSYLYTPQSGRGYEEGGNRQVNWETYTNTSSAGNHSHTIVSGGDTETRPKNIALMYIIKK
jgi:microcystin-dependent protein